MSRQVRRSCLFATMLVALSVPFMMGQGSGCCVVPGQNTAPTANAGPDQTVAPGATVNIAGSATDPDVGDTLTYAWIQTAGPAVVLTGVNTATPSFTAPATATVLSFNMTVSDGNGGSDTDAVNVTVQTTTPPTPARLFIANAAVLANNVTSYLDPATINGNIAPDTNLAGISTQISVPADIVVNPAGQLLVANNTPSITSYNNASATNGNLAPNGNLSGAATQLTLPSSLAINAAQNVLMVADAANQINAYDMSGGTLNGNTPPTRVITAAAGVINAPTGINFGASDNLYVANNLPNNVLVFANASNLNGVQAPTRVITSAAFLNIWDVFVDGSDNLYVVNAAGQINVYANASTLNGLVAPTTTLTVLGATWLTAVVVDSSDVGYIADFGLFANSVYSYDNISNLNAALAPHRTIAGVSTQLARPSRLYLAE